MKKLLLLLAFAAMTSGSYASDYIDEIRMIVDPDNAWRVRREINDRRAEEYREMQEDQLEALRDIQRSIEEREDFENE